MIETYIQDCVFYIYPHKIPENEISKLIDCFGSNNFGYLNDSKILFIKTSIFNIQLVNTSEHPDFENLNILELRCRDIKLKLLNGFCYSPKCIANKDYIKDNYFTWKWYEHVHVDDSFANIQAEYLKVRLAPIVDGLKRKIQKHLDEARMLTDHLGEFADG